MIERKIAVVDQALARVHPQSTVQHFPSTVQHSQSTVQHSASSVQYSGSSVQQFGSGVGSGAIDAHSALRSLGGGEFAVLTGVVLGAVEAGTGVVLDGLATSVCALAAVRMEPAVAAHLVAGHHSRERAHAAVLLELGLEPLLDLRIRTGEGVGAALAVGIIKDGLQLRADVARTRPVHTS
jgi:NaMN:DMB phosphoribosyltransferase